MKSLKQALTFGSGVTLTVGVEVTGGHAIALNSIGIIPFVTLSILFVTLSILGLNASRRLSGIHE